MKTPRPFVIPRSIRHSPLLALRGIEADFGTERMAGFVLANGSMSSNQSGEGDIRAIALKMS